MSRYRKIDPRIWNDAKFRCLSNSGKLAFMFLLTHPHMTALGAMRATFPGLAAEIGWTPKAFGEAFMEASAKGMVEHDETACILWLPNFLKYNRPESPNVVKAWTASLDLIPECALKDKAIQSAKALAEGMSEAFAQAFPKALREALSKPMPYQEQEQEQESTTAVRPKNKNVPESFAIAWEIYPKRAGDNPKDRALKAWRARKGEGESEEAMLAGARRYAEFIRSTSKENTEFVKQAATFFGPSKAYLEPWTLPEPHIAAPGGTKGAAW